MERGGLPGRRRFPEIGDAPAPVASGASGEATVHATSAAAARGIENREKVMRRRFRKRWATRTRALGVTRARRNEPLGPSSRAYHATAVRPRYGSRAAGAAAAHRECPGANPREPRRAGGPGRSRDAAPGAGEADDPLRLDARARGDRTRSPVHAVVARRALGRAGAPFAGCTRGGSHTRSGTPSGATRSPDSAIAPVRLQARAGGGARTSPPRARQSLEAQRLGQ